jgi:hypothetical protein
VDLTTSGSEENLLLSAYLRSSAPLWLNTVGRSHSKYSTTVEPAYLSRDTSCDCLLERRLGVRCYDYCLTGPALMLWVVLFTTLVTILRFTITPITAVVCLRWVLCCGCIVHTSFHSFANSACYCLCGGSHTWVNPSS